MFCTHLDPISKKVAFVMASLNSCQAQAKREIFESFSLCTYSLRNIGIVIDRTQSNLVHLLRHQLLIGLCFLTILYHVISDVVFLVDVMLKSPTVMDIVPGFHTFGYGLQSGY